MPGCLQPLPNYLLYKPGQGRKNRNPAVRHTGLCTPARGFSAFLIRWVLLLHGMVLRLERCSGPLNLPLAICRILLAFRPSPVTA